MSRLLQLREQLQQRIQREKEQALADLQAQRQAVQQERERIRAQDPVGSRTRRIRGRATSHSGASPHVPSHVKEPGDRKSAPPHRQPVRPLGSGRNRVGSGGVRGLHPMQDDPYAGIDHPSSPGMTASPARAGVNRKGRTTLRPLNDGTSTESEKTMTDSSAHVGSEQRGKVRRHQRQGHVAERRKPSEDSIVLDDPPKPRLGRRAAAPAASLPRRESATQDAFAAFEAQQKEEEARQRQMEREQAREEEERRKEELRRKKKEAMERKRREEERRQRMKEREQQREAERRRLAELRRQQEAEQEGSGEQHEESHHMQKDRSHSSFDDQPLHGQGDHGSGTEPASMEPHPPETRASSGRRQGRRRPPQQQKPPAHDVASAARSDSPPIRPAAAAPEDSRPLPAATEPVVSAAVDENGNEIELVLVPCSICGRKFQEERLAKHAKVCEKNAKSKRKKFDMQKKRLNELGSDAIVLAKRAEKTEAKYKKKLKPSNWRQKHENFIGAIRAAKGDTTATTGPIHDTSDYEQCPHCGRTFNEAAAERHIPICAKKAKATAISNKGKGRR